MNRIEVSTEKNKQIIDITNLVQKQLSNNCTLVNISTLHTTCSITTADLDPGTDKDMLDAFEEMVPDLNYRHPHDPSHVGDHIMSSIIGPSVTLPVENGKFQLGTWQRIVLVELNGPRERTLTITEIS